MPYLVNKTDGSELVTVRDNTTDNTRSSIKLVGKGALDYGEILNENQVHMLEHFANSTSPLNPLRGQLWYNTTTQRLVVWNGSAWVSISNQGDIVGAGNLGAGSGIFAQKEGSYLQFKSLVAGGGISITSASGHLTITNTAGGSENIGITDSLAGLTFVPSNYRNRILTKQDGGQVNVDLTHAGAVDIPDETLYVLVRADFIIQTSSDQKSRLFSADTVANLPSDPNSARITLEPSAGGTSPNLEAGVSATWVEKIDTVNNRIAIRVDLATGMISSTVNVWLEGFYIQENALKVTPKPNLIVKDSGDLVLDTTNQLNFGNNLSVAADSETQVTINGPDFSLPLMALDYPTIATTDLRIPVTATTSVNGGIVSIPAGIRISLGEETVAGQTGQVKTFTTAVWSQDLAPSSTYYVRANVVNGVFTPYVQKGSDGDPIPAGLKGTAGQGSGGGFDSTQIDILIAKVVTGIAGSMPTITTLANAKQLVFVWNIPASITKGPAAQVPLLTVDQQIETIPRQYASNSTTLNWARTPTMSLAGYGGIFLIYPDVRQGDQFLGVVGDRYTAYFINISGGGTNPNGDLTSARAIIRA